MGCPRVASLPPPELPPVGAVCGSLGATPRLELQHRKIVAPVGALLEHRLAAGSPTLPVSYSQAHHPHLTPDLPAFVAGCSLPLLSAELQGGQG